MSVISDGQWEAPFWGASKSFITGQDMLGMQIASIATYATLLPGLTNLTQRIRYYGFYMWLLEQYARTRHKVSVSEFHRFVRRGELILAFVMAHNYVDERAVVGSNYAKKRLQQNNTGSIDIAAGADIENDNIYWKYSSGAFGQYYQGALSAMGLIAPSKNEKSILVCTPHYGRKLAGLFEDTVDESIREKYLGVINSGTLSREELTSFSKAFSLTAIKPQTPEWDFYIEMLFGKDFPTTETQAGHTTFRVETLLLYMQYLADSDTFESVSSFPHSFLYRLWDKAPFDGYTASMGWHYYALNENAHFALETLLWVLLVELEIQGSITLSDMADHFTNQINSAFDELYDSTSLDRNFNELSFLDFSAGLYQQGFHPTSFTDKIEETGSSEAFRSGVYALNVLGLIYQHEKQQLVKLNAYSRQHGMHRDADATELLSWMQKNENLTLPAFVRKLVLQHIINRHIEVAMRKMRNRNENTLKFILEDNILKPVATVQPVWTGPRIKSVHQYLVDLKLVENDELTALGKELLNERLQ